MPFNPTPIDLVGGPELVQCTPKILVLNWFLGLGPPAILLPAFDPKGDAVSEVLGVGIKLHGAGFLEGLESLDGRRQFHSVVGGLRCYTAQGTGELSVSQYGGPSARAGIPMAAAVGVNGQPLQGEERAWRPAQRSRNKEIRGLGGSNRQQADSPPSWSAAGSQ